MLNDSRSGLDHCRSTALTDMVRQAIPPAVVQRELHDGVVIIGDIHICMNRRRYKTRRKTIQLLHIRSLLPASITRSSFLTMRLASFGLLFACVAIAVMALPAGLS